VTLELHQLERRLEHLRVRHRDRFRRLLASLAECGQQTPIVVIAEQDRYLVIDGHQRIAALEQLRRDTVEATAWTMSESEALLLCSSLRSGAEPESALEQGWLLREIQTQTNGSVEELAKRLDRSATWAARRLALVETLPEGAQQQVRDGRIAPQIAMRYLAPVARIDREACLRMAAVFASRPWTTREAAAFYQAWRNARAKTSRERILEKPELFLKTQEHKPPLPEPEGLERDLEQIAAIARRASQRGAEELAAHPELLARVQQAQRQLQQLAQRMQAMQALSDSQTHDDSIATRDDPGVARARDRDARDRAAAPVVASKRAQNPALQNQPGAQDRTGGESSTVPRANPRVATGLEGESRASP